MTHTLLAIGRFVLHFLEMLLAMYVGMLIFMAVPGVMALPGVLHHLGMAMAMTLPMVGWMRVRGHAWRHGLEMAAGMLVPWAVFEAVPFLSGAADAAMLLGMLGIMLVRRDHYAHQHGQPRVSRRRVPLPFAYLGAMLAVPVVVGAVNLGAKATAPREPISPPVYSVDLPASPTPDPSKKIAVVLTGFEGAEIGDTLEAYEVLARSRMFNVYSVAPERTVLPLRTGTMPSGNSIDFAPHFSFAQYDAEIGGAPDVLAIPYFAADPTSARDTVIFDWIRGHVGPNTTILGICSGNMVLADSGLLAGRTATTNTGTFEYVESHSPTTQWLHDLRYVDDGNIVTSSNLTSGIDAALHVVDRVGGRALALDVARQIGYTQTGALDDPRFQPPSIDLLPRLLIAAYEAPEQRTGVLVYDGVTELGVSGIVDPLEGTVSARTFFMAPQHGVVESRNGFLFVPRYEFSTVPELDRVLVAAGEASAKEQALAVWTGRPAEDIYAKVGDGETAYDASLRDLARTRSGLLAHMTADGLFYTANPGDFADASPAPSELLLVGLLMLLGAALVFGARLALAASAASKSTSRSRQPMRDRAAQPSITPRATV